MAQEGSQASGCSLAFGRCSTWNRKGGNGRTLPVAWITTIRWLRVFLSPSVRARTLGHP